MVTKILHKTIFWSIIIAFGLVTASIGVLAKDIYYTYAPVSNFIDFQKLDFQDRKIGDTTQVLLSYRNSSVNTKGDFTYKIYCNGINHLDWTYETNGILLDKTKGDEVKTIEMPVRFNLPVGECIIYADIVIDIQGYKKYIELEDSFKVLE